MYSISVKNCDSKIFKRCMELLSIKIYHHLITSAPATDKASNNPMVPIYIWIMICHETNHFVTSDNMLTPMVPYSYVIPPTMPPILMYLTPKITII